MSECKHEKISYTAKFKDTYRNFSHMEIRCDDCGEQLPDSYAAELFKDEFERQLKKDKP